MNYDASTTAILLIDPYNDFLSEGGKLWPRVKAVAEEAHLLSHLREVVSTARTQAFKIIFVPHHRWQAGDYVSFDNPSPYQLGSAKAQVFAKTAGAEHFMTTSSPRRATSLRSSIGDRAALPTPTSICNSSSTASATSS